MEYERVKAGLLADGHGGRRTDMALFGENGASFFVAVPEERWDELQKALGGVPHDSIARVGGDGIKIGNLIDVGLDDLRGAYERDLFETHAPEGGHIG